MTLERKDRSIVKISITLPRWLLTILDTESKAQKTTRSQLIVDILKDAIT